MSVPATAPPPAATAPAYEQNAEDFFGGEITKQPSTNAFGDPFGDGPAPTRQESGQDITSSGRSFESDPFGDGPAPPKSAPPPAAAPPPKAADFDPFGEGSILAQKSSDPSCGNSSPPAQHASDPFATPAPASQPQSAAADPFGAPTVFFHFISITIFTTLQSLESNSDVRSKFI